MRSTAVSTSSSQAFPAARAARGPAPRRSSCPGGRFWRGPCGRRAARARARTLRSARRTRASPALRHRTGRPRRRRRWRRPGRRRSCVATARPRPVRLGALGTSTNTRPPSTLASKRARHPLPGGSRWSPVSRSKIAWCHGQMTRLPTRLPFFRGAPLCVQVAPVARTRSPSRASRILVSPTATSVSPSAGRSAKARTSWRMGRLRLEWFHLTTFEPLPFLG